MKHKNLKQKVLSCVLSAAICASAFGIATPVYAGDTWPFEGDAVINVNHPRTIGQRVYDIENWDPDSEPYADLMKASVPLQERNEAFRATQANPELTSEAEIYNMGGDYGNSFFEATPYNNEFSQFAFNFWQYIDYYASWHGVTTKGGPD